MPRTDTHEARPRSRRGIWIGLAVVFFLGVLVWTQGSRFHFNFGQFLIEIRSVAWHRVGVAIALTYGCFWLRAVRWRVLLAERKPISLTSLYTAQLIGFGSVALFGRAADLVRPYLIARRSGTPVATQIAIYSIERTLDLGAAATIFSVTLLFVPRIMPHHAVIVRAGLLALAGTLVLFCGGLLVRFAGERLAVTMERVLRSASPRLATKAGSSIRDLREGFSAIASTREFSLAAGLSIVMWLGIALGYLESVHSFRAAPALVHLTFPETMFLLAAGIGGSLLQVPVLGWVTQIGVLAAALHGFFGVPLETASACGAILLVTTSLCIIPAALLLANRHGTAMRPVSRPSTA